MHRDLDSKSRRRTEAVRRSITVTLTPDNHLTVYGNLGDTFERLIDTVQLSGIPRQPPLPDTLKFGFAAASGSLTNFHEIRNLVVGPMPPDLTMTKAHGEAFTTGSIGTFTITVSNSSLAGPTVGPIVVTDTFPADLQFVSGHGTGWSCAGSQARAVCKYTPAAATPIGPGTDLPALHLRAAVADDAGPSVVNTAEVWTPYEPEWLRDDNVSVDEVAIAVAPRLKAIKNDELFADRDGSDNVSPGDQLTYTITISNTGSAAAQGVMFSDSPDPNTALVDGSVVTTMGRVTSGNSGESSVEVAIGPMAGGETCEIRFSVIIDASIDRSISHISNQGVVDARGIARELTDDPDTRIEGDATTTRLNHMQVPTPTPTATATPHSPAAILIPLLSKHYLLPRCIAVEREPNDSPAQALRRRPLCNDMAVTASLPPAPRGGRPGKRDPDDYYVFYATAPGVVTASLTGIKRNPGGPLFGLFLYTCQPRSCELLGYDRPPESAGSARVTVSVDRPTLVFVRVWPNPKRPQSYEPYELKVLQRISTSGT